MADVYLYKYLENSGYIEVELTGAYARNKDSTLVRIRRCNSMDSMKPKWVNVNELSPVMLSNHKFLEEIIRNHHD